MIRQAAFAGKNKLLKGELHCHTTRSDGRLTPEEAMRIFEENGYDFVSLTDHRIYNYKNFAPDSDIILIPGMEYDNSFHEGKAWRCFHTVCIGPLREDGNGYMQDEVFSTGTANGQEEYQAYLDRIHEKNNLTILCHPEWSQTRARHFEKLRGNFAMEIWNTGSVLSYNCDMDAAYWDELLGQGIRIFGVAADDAHGMGAFCRGWVMVNAEKNLRSILSSLESGAFYSSTGPEIYDFYIEDGRAHIECSPVSLVTLSCDGHLTRVVRDKEDKITSADFELKNWTGDCPYARITVYRTDGTRAWTNPIWID